MKTKFEELWSLIMYTNTYDLSKIRFWYLNDLELDSLMVSDIMNKEDRLLMI